MTEKRAAKREIFGWAMFDFANQAYTLLIITVVFSVVFPRIIVGDGPDFRIGNLLWSVSLAISYACVCITGPIFGAILDYTGTRKHFLFVSYLVTIVATALLYFVTPGLIVLGMILIIVSNFAYSTGEAFIASFLPDLGPPDDLGKISGIGWAVGYLGGMVSTVVVLLFIGDVSPSNFDNLRYVGPLSAVFFLLGAIPTFIWLKDRGQRRALPKGVSVFSIGYLRLKRTFMELAHFRDLAIFLASMFFAMAGLSIIVSFTFIYGDQVIAWDDTYRTIMFVITQITAALGAVFFGLIQDRIGAKRTFNITLFIWIAAVLLIYFTPHITHSLNSISPESDFHPQQIFLFVGCVAGLGLGAVQSASRTMVGLFTPKGRSAEFFGFWGQSGKLAAVFGIFGLGLLQLMVGLHTAILMCAAFFSAALFASFFVNEARGRAAAIEASERL